MRETLRKALLSLDEDLASSLALRFAAAQARELGIALQAFHVVTQEGSAPEHLGWVNHSREKVLRSAGFDAVQRLVRTENIDYPKTGEPRIALGDKDREVRRELAAGDYSLYIEGYQSRTEPADFHRFLAAERFQRSPCPLLLVKNLVAQEHLLLLLDRDMNAGQVAAGLSDLYREAAARVELTVLTYKFGEGRELVFQERGRNATLERVAAQLAQAGWAEPEWLVVQGPPAKVAQYMRGHGLVATAFPRSAGPRADLIAHLANPVLLFPEQQR